MQLYADYEPGRLIDFLRASNYYSLAKAYAICEKKDLVLEMVFLLGRMGNNKKALHLIIEKLGDVNRVSNNPMVLDPLLNAFVSLLGNRLR